MAEVPRPTVLALTHAQRARTAVAACDAVRWPSDDEQVAVPFVEQAGSLLLIVTDEQRQDLLDIGSGCVALNAPEIASVRLSGDFWPVAGNAAEDILTEIRACHRECLDCPTRRLSQLVGFQVDLVELKVGNGYRRVDLSAYVTAQPDWVLALGIQVRAHLNAAHGDVVLQAACARAGQRPDQVISAQLEWIDGHGVELSMIDESGGRWIRCEYDVPVVDPERLSATVHQSLELAVARAKQPPAEG
jgi:hypothetical protein